MNRLANRLSKLEESNKPTRRIHIHYSEEVSFADRAPCQACAEYGEPGEHDMVIMVMYDEAEPIQRGGENL